MMGWTTYLKDPPGVVLVVCNAAITHSPLSHDRIEAGIGERGSTSTAGWWFAASNKAADRRVPSVLLLNFASSLVADEEEHASCNGCNGNDTDNDACGDASLAWSSTR
jgi:hypothetical protein